MANFVHHGGPTSPGAPLPKRFARYGVQGPMGRERLDIARKAQGTVFAAWDELPEWCQEAPPPQVQAAFEEVFRPEDRMDPDGVPRLVLAKNPVVNRWTLYERDKRYGHRGYAVVSVFCEECPDDDYVASDFRGDEFLEYLAGSIGEYRLPTKRDFEIIQSTNAHTRTLDEREAVYSQYEDEMNAKYDREMEAIEHDVASYYGLLSRRALDGDDFKHQASWSDRDETWTHRKWVEVDKGGFKMRYRIRAEDRDEFEAIRQATKDGPLPEPVEPLIERAKRTLYRSPKDPVIRQEPAKAPEAEETVGVPVYADSH